MFYSDKPDKKHCYKVNFVSRVKQLMTIYNVFMINGKIQSEIVHVLVESDSRYQIIIIIILNTFIAHNTSNDSMSLCALSRKERITSKSNKNQKSTQKQTST